MNSYLDNSDTNVNQEHKKELYKMIILILKVPNPKTYSIVEDRLFFMEESLKNTG